MTIIKTVFIASITVGDWKNDLRCHWIDFLSFLMGEVFCCVWNKVLKIRWKIKTWRMYTLKGGVRFADGLYQTAYGVKRVLFCLMFKLFTKFTDGVLYSTIVFWSGFSFVQSVQAVVCYMTFFILWRILKSHDNKKLFFKTVRTTWWDGGAKAFQRKLICSTIWK